MKVNSNTIKLEKQSYEELEKIIKKIASDNKINNIKNVEVELSKESGVVKFAVEDFNKNELIQIYEKIKNNEESEEDIRRINYLMSELVSSDIKLPTDISDILWYAVKLLDHKKWKSDPDYGMDFDREDWEQIQDIETKEFNN